eukprot:m.240318 g.240318  ORF g.240318 m.240318 type:complete len:110 (+) comp33764_c7_seq3:266-595(+)
MDNTLDASDDEAPGAYWEIGPDLEPTDIARKMNTYSFRSNGKAPPEQFATQPGLTRWTYRGRRDPSKSVSFSDGGGGGGGIKSIHVDVISLGDVVGGISQRVTACLCIL